MPASHTFARFRTYYLSVNFRFAYGLPRISPV